MKVEHTMNKLIQVVLAMAVIFHYPAMLYFLIVFAVKEIYMAAMGFYLIKAGKSGNRAGGWEKVCTAVIYAGCFLLLLFHGISNFSGNLLIVAMMLTVMVSLFCDINVHIRILTGRGFGRMKTGTVLLILFLGVVYMLVGGTLPYIKNREVSKDYRQDFSVAHFMDGAEGEERAGIITDNGEALAERIRLIEQAEDRIVLSTFSFCADTSGKQMIAALKAAADRNVQVQILVDGFNSWLNMEGNPYFLALADHENVQIKIYNKVNPLVPWKGVSRLHDKYIVADEKVYLLGGRNTFDYFLGDQKGYKNYDMDVLVYNTAEKEGSPREILDYFEQMWSLDCCKLWQEHNVFNGFLPSVRRAEEELDQLYAAMRKEHTEWFIGVDYEEKTVPVDKVSLLSGCTGLYAKEPRVFYGLCQLMQSAKENVAIHTPYIMCDDMMYGELSTVCEKVPEVTLMTNSALNNGNPFGAVDYLLHKEKILDVGLRVLEYDGNRSYHGKCIAIDNDISIVGSFNMDMKSAYQDTETMLVIKSEKLNEQLREAMESYEQSAHEAELKKDEIEKLFAKDVPLRKRIQRWAIRILDPYLRFLL